MLVDFKKAKYPPLSPKDLYFTYVLDARIVFYSLVAFTTISFSLVYP